MIIEIFVTGLVIGFIFYELTDLTAGGVIAPAYFALYMHSPQRIASTILVALLVWILIEMLSRYLVIYGRRRLLIALLAGFCLKYLFEGAVVIANVSYLDLSAIGYIIPGLIANEMSRQKAIPTIIAIVIVTAVVFLIELLFFRI